MKDTSRYFIENEQLHFDISELYARKAAAEKFQKRIKR